MTHYIICEADEASHIGRIILNRPDDRNAMSAEMAADICAALTRLEQDDDIKVIVLSAKGEHFSGGSDAAQVESNIRNAPGGKNHKTPSQRARLAAAENIWWGPAGLYSRLQHCRKVTIIATQGECFEVGLYLTLCCDLVVAATTSNFANPRWQHVGVDGDITMLIAAVGLKRAKEMIYASARWSATEALAYGLVDEVVEPSELKTAAQNLAKSCALIMRDGIAAEKQVVFASLAKMQINTGFAAAVIASGWGTNIHFREGEFNFLREARQNGLSAALGSARSYFA